MPEDQELQSCSKSSSPAPRRRFRRTSDPVATALQTDSLSSGSGELRRPFLDGLRHLGPKEVEDSTIRRGIFEIGAHRGVSQADDHAEPPVESRAAGLDLQFHRLVHANIYPIYGIEFALLERRHTLLYPTLIELLRVCLLSLAVSVVLLMTLSPLLTGLVTTVTFGLIPWWLAIGPAVILSLLLAAWVTSCFFGRLERKVCKDVVKEVVAVEKVELRPDLLQISPGRHIAFVIGCLLLPIGLIPVIGTILLFYLNGLRQAYIFAFTRAVALDLPNKRRTAFKLMWQLQLLGLLATFLEILPVLGPFLRFTNLIGRCLFAADAVKIAPTSAEPPTSKKLHKLLFERH